MTREQTFDYLCELTNRSGKDLIKDSDERNPRLGLSFPKLKEISLSIYKQDPYDFLDSKRVDIYDLQIIEANLIGKIKDINQALKYFDKAAVYAKDWSVVDSLSQRFVISRKHPDETLKLLKTYAKLEDEYLNRIVAVTLLSHFLNDESINDVLSLLSELKHEGYYTQMAIAWAYATIMIKYPQFVFDILNKRKLLKWTHQKTIQKILESYRIDDHTKQEVKKLSIIK